MRIDGCVSGGAGEVLILPIGYVRATPVVAVFLGKTKVNEEQLVAVPADAH